MWGSVWWCVDWFSLYTYLLHILTLYLRIIFYDAGVYINRLTCMCPALALPTTTSFMNPMMDGNKVFQAHGVFDSATITFNLLGHQKQPSCWVVEQTLLAAFAQFSMFNICKNLVKARFGHRLWADVNDTRMLLKLQIAHKQAL